MAAPQIAGTPQDQLARSSGIQAVEQVGPGKYVAKFADGRSLNVVGATGEKLYNQYSGGAPPPPKPPEAGAPAEQAPQAQPGQAPPAQQQPQQGQPPKLGPLGYTMEAVDGAGRKVVGQAVMTKDGVRVYVPGSKGTPGGLTELGKQTIERQTETERTIAEGRAREDAARQAGVQIAAEEVAQQRAYQEERERQAVIQAQDQKDEIREIERRVQDKEIEFAKARTAFTESRVDPERYTRGNWLAGLGMALGSFGASLSKTPNFAQEYVSMKIAQDIRAQELAIELKGKNADNALMDLKNAMGSLPDAKLAYRQFMTEAAAAKFNALSLRSKDKAIAADYQMAAGQLMSQRAQIDQERKQGNIERVWKDKLYYRQGTAGSSGGYATPTFEAFSKVNEEGRQNEELRLKREKEAAGGADAKVVTGDRTEKIASYANSLRAADTIMKELQKRGVEKDAYDDPTEGAIDRLGNSQSNETLNQQTIEMSKGLQTAFGKSDRDAEDALKLASGGGSGRDRFQAAARTKAKVVQGIRTELSTLPAAQQNTLLDTLPADIKKAVLGQQ